MGAFTPGPWLIHAKHRWIVPAEDAFKEPDDALPICQLRDPDERLTEDETLANGFLIAAAPELYALGEQFERVAEYELRKLKRENPADDEGARLRQLNLNLIRAALAKARGEQQ